MLAQAESKAGEFDAKLSRDEVIETAMAQAKEEKAKSEEKKAKAQGGAPANPLPDVPLSPDGKQATSGGGVSGAVADPSSVASGGAVQTGGTRPQPGGGGGAGAMEQFSPGSHQLRPDEVGPMESLGGGGVPAGAPGESITLPDGTIVPLGPGGLPVPDTITTARRVRSADRRVPRQVGGVILPFNVPGEDRTEVTTTENVLTPGQAIAARQGAMELVLRENFRRDSLEQTRQNLAFKNMQSLITEYGSEHGETIAKIAQLQSNGDFPGAADLYATLPEPLSRKLVKSQLQTEEDAREKHKLQIEKLQNELDIQDILIDQLSGSGGVSLSNILGLPDYGVIGGIGGTKLGVGASAIPSLGNGTKITADAVAKRLNAGFDTNGKPKGNLLAHLSASQGMAASIGAVWVPTQKEGFAWGFGASQDEVAQGYQLMSGKRLLGELKLATATSKDLTDEQKLARKTMAEKYEARGFGNIVNGRLVFHDPKSLNDTNSNHYLIKQYIEALGGPSADVVLREDVPEPTEEELDAANVVVRMPAEAATPSFGNPDPTVMREQLVDTLKGVGGAVQSGVEGVGRGVEAAQDVAGQALGGVAGAARAGAEAAGFGGGPPVAPSTPAQRVHQDAARANLGLAMSQVLGVREATPPSEVQAFEAFLGSQGYAPEMFIQAHPEVQKIMLKAYQSERTSTLQPGE
jgi:hypothetical protein